MRTAAEHEKWHQEVLESGVERRVTRRSVSRPWLNNRRLPAFSSRIRELLKFFYFLFIPAWRQSIQEVLGVLFFRLSIHFVVLSSGVQIPQPTGDGREAAALQPPTFSNSFYLSLKPVES